ncbi:MAG: lycopene cyclase domain-containing protein [Cyclobacteriaceae bacterium]|jgi:lycopene cyclase domain-containing protein
MTPIYLIINLATIIFPLVRSFEPRIKYAKKWYALFPAIIITATFFIVWDVVFTKNGVWGFNENYLIGVDIFGLPLEEWLFFITVPFASVFIYECIRYFLPMIRTSLWLRTFSTAFSLGLILVATYNWELSYTFWCFCFTGIFLTIISYQNPIWLGKFWVAYFIHLIPFIAVNGILTGSYLDAPIVWYNDDHNVGFRLFTIPIEDTIYAMLLLLMNVTFFEYFRKHFR